MTIVKSSGSWVDLKASLKVVHLVRKVSNQGLLLFRILRNVSLKNVGIGQYDQILPYKHQVKEMPEVWFNKCENLNTLSMNFVMKTEKKCDSIIKITPFA